MRCSHPAAVPAILVLGMVGLAWASMARARDEPIPIGPGLTPAYLRCESLVRPAGIDVRGPRLSWIVESSARGQKQTAYQILVADDSDLLARGEGNLWDSGRVTSDETSAIVYASRPLRSHQECFWKVRVWDRDGKPSGWSQVEVWTMGLLDPSDWRQAGWIGSDAARKLDISEAPLVGAKWIWHAGDRGRDKPRAHRLFVAALRLPAAAKVEKAELIAAADDFFRFTINGNLVINAQPGTGGWDHPRSADVTAQLRPGVENTIRVEVQNTSSGPAGLLAKLTVRTADGQTTTLVTDGSWKTLENPGANWHNRALETRDWPAAEVLGDYGMAPWGRLKLAHLVLPPPSYLRTGFRVSKPVRRATLYATALGIFDVHLNGRRVSDDRFNPGWTDYTKRVYYRAYDVTDRLRPGDNALGAILADGWYSGYVGFGKKRDHYGTRPRLRALLHLELADGTTQDIITDSKWRAATGPILEADFLMGETHDARRAMPGWDTPGFDDGAWHPVDIGAELSPVVQWHPAPPVRTFAELKPKTITEPKPGTYVLDLGQNFAGVVRLRASGEPGRRITLRFAERLNPDGTIYTTNLREARATDTYICNGRDETWEPRFTFHGFQYVEITGLATRPAEDTITGVAVSSDTPVVGSFACSDPMLNKLFSNIYWTQRANFIDIPTDCPQRDERLGWTGDAQVYIETASLICDVQAFFNKWLVDLTDGQRADGQFPMVAPVKVAGDDGGPGWADAGVICPWTIYQVYGDRRVLERQYPSMIKFIEFCRRRSTPDLLPPAQFHCFGDWLSINADTPKDVIYTAYFAHSARLTADAAEVLGKMEDATKYRRLFEQIRNAFKRAYIGPDGRIKGNTQAVYVLAIAFRLVEPKSLQPMPGAHASDGQDFERAARYLVEDIEKQGNHLSTGFIGTKSLMQALSMIGRHDIAFRLLHNDTFPSWGFSIKQGATSIWERWDGWTPEKGFQDPGMNSFAHYSFGAVYGWMVHTIGGIELSEARNHMSIAPVLDPHVTWARTSYRSRFGTIATSWKRDEDRLVLELTIPANSRATVRLPSEARDVTEGGRPMAAAEGVGDPLDYPRVPGFGFPFIVESGTYRFSMRVR